MKEVVITASRSSVQKLLRQLQNLSSGSSEMGKAILIRMGLAALDKIHHDFADKADGGGGALSQPWKPLAPSTIAKRRAKAVKGKRGRRRQEAGDAKIQILRDTGLLFNSLSPGIPGAASHHMPSRKARQVFRLNPGSVTIGTNRVGAIYHHEGRFPPLPQRRLWPAPEDWPKNWWSEILQQGREGLLEVAQTILSRG